jgi:hypothetical protein
MQGVIYRHVRYRHFLQRYCILKRFRETTHNSITFRENLTRERYDMKRKLPAYRFLSKLRQIYRFVCKF